MGGLIKPIETLYRGYRFRSRTEARWAVFFDTAGIEWSYEEQGWKVPGGHNLGFRTDYQKFVRKPVLYLPDFYLPQQECWVEIKGGPPTSQECATLMRLVYGTGRTGYIFWGQIPMLLAEGELYPDNSGDYAVSAWAFRPSEYGSPAGWTVYEQDNNRWCECPTCGLIGITYRGAVEELPCACFDHIPGWEIGLTDATVPHTFNAASPLLVEAYAAARGARFEHRERPGFMTDSLRDKLRQERLKVETLEAKFAQIRKVLNLGDIPSD